MTDMVEMKNAFGKDFSRGQSAGRPEWQHGLSLDDKLYADRLMNTYAFSNADEDLRIWWMFRSRYSALNEHADKSALRGEEGEKVG